MIEDAGSLLKLEKGEYIDEFINVNKGTISECIDLREFHQSTEVCKFCKGIFEVSLDHFFHNFICKVECINCNNTGYSDWLTKITGE